MAATCKTVSEDGRIMLLIRKGEKGYGDFSTVLDNIEENGIQSWYGDVRDETGKEQSGLIITSKIRQG